MTGDTPEAAAREVAERLANEGRPLSVKEYEAIIRDALLSCRRAGREDAARWHDEQAAGCRNIAQTLRREWCGQDIPAEDRRANFTDAREHEALAGVHERHARAIRALAGGTKEGE